MLLVLKLSSDLRESKIQSPYQIKTSPENYYYEFSGMLSKKIINIATIAAKEYLKSKIFGILKTFSDLSGQKNEWEFDQMWQLIEPSCLEIEVDHVIDTKNFKKYCLKTPSNYCPSVVYWPYVAALGTAASVAWLFKRSLNNS